MINGQERWGTVRDGQGLWCHDGGRNVTMGHDDLKMVTGQNHNFYCKKHLKDSNLLKSMVQKRHIWGA